MKTVDKGRSCSCNRAGLLYPKLCDPILFPRFIRARVPETEKFAKSPVRKNPGVFNNFNITTSEPLLKYSKRIISPINKIEKIRKFIRTYNPVKSDPITHTNLETVQNWLKKPFEPSLELMKYNEDRSRIQRKRQNFSKSHESSKYKQKTVSEMEMILQSPNTAEDKITPKPHQTPFKVLKSQIC